MSAKLLHSSNFPLGIGLAEEQRRLTAAAPRQVRDCRKSSRGRSEAHEQLAIGDRPDAGGAQQSDAVD
jgi:hypothetical protein